MLGETVDSCPDDCDEEDCGDDVCDIWENEESCPEDCVESQWCGNNEAEGDEVCDGFDLRGVSCEELGLGTGTPRCEEGCMDYDVSTCSAEHFCTEEESNGVVNCIMINMGNVVLINDCVEESVSSACFEAYNDLMFCAEDEGCGTNFPCIQEGCSDEWAAVFGGEPVSDIPAPYGYVEVDFATSYIRSSSDSGNEDGIEWDPFATGYYGSSDAPILPPELSYAYSYAFYEPSRAIVQAIQVLMNEDGGAMQPVVVIDIPMDHVYGDSVGIGLGETGTLWVVEANFDAWTFECVHAIGVGSLDLFAHDVDSHGILEVWGEVDLFHPRNVPAYGGDITAEYGIEACEPF